MSMFSSVKSNLKTAFSKLRNNPQLAFTVLVAIVTVGAFVFMANRFIRIANDAQERLIHIRVGSIQDAFVSFAGDYISDSNSLNRRINSIIAANETIESFRVVTKREAIVNDAPVTVYYILASNVPSEIDTMIPNVDFLYMLASSDPGHSITIETTKSGTRGFNTARAITGPQGEILGVVLSSQTMSQADIAIERDIANSIYLLVVVLILIMILFLRHSKIIDYLDLYKKLKEVDQLKDDFISMASHELRTPLSVIRGYAEYIREDKNLSGDMKDYAMKIDVSAKSLDSLVADILDVSRIQQGRMSFTMEKVSPKQIVESVVSSLDIPAKEKGLTISFDGSRSDENQSIIVDKDRFRQVLVNLAGNAVKYTQKGFVKVSQYVENDKLCFVIEDSGIGISAEERAHLFEKFYRIKNKDTENIRGTGLGLWICAELIKEMKGTIEVESMKGVGSRFVLSFPLVHN